MVSWAGTWLSPSNGPAGTGESAVQQLGGELEAVGARAVHRDDGEPVAQLEVPPEAGVARRRHQHAVARVAEGVEAEFFEAGHILGSASIRVRAGSGSAARTVLFSGDIGRWDKPFLNDPAPCSEADWVLMESTYGDRLHGGEDTIEGELRDILNAAVRAGGNVVIPSFAIERSQELLYYLNRLQRARQAPRVPVFLDSPMAIEATRIYWEYPQLYDEAATKLDLGRAYVEMDDRPAAEALLLEVAEEGNPEQQAEARELLARIKAS